VNESLNIQGLSYPLTFDSRGKLKASSNERHIAESVAQILLTRRGSHPFQPDFGSEIPNRVFDPVNVGTMIKADAEEALRRWEPRIDNLLVTLTDSERLSLGEAEYNVNYRIKGEIKSQNVNLMQKVF